MLKIALSAKRMILSFGFFSVGIVLLAMGLAIYFYRVKFSGDLSDTSAEWSNFGGFLGGIGGPLVSFITLLAVLKTVYMQRELLDTQKIEFRELLALQETAAAKQDEQISLAKSEAHWAKVQAYQATLLNLVETFIAQYKREAEGMAAAADKVMSLEGSVAARIAAAEASTLKKEEAERKISALIVLALEISIMEYKNTEELKKVFGPQLMTILNIPG